MCSTPKRAAGRQALAEAATAARHLGALAYVRDPRVALTAYEESVALDPANPIAWNQIGLLRYQHGDVAVALTAFEHAAKYAAADRDARVRGTVHNNFGLALNALGQGEEAQRQFAAASAIADEHALPELRAVALGNLGVLCLTRGQFDRAHELLIQHRKARQRRPALGQSCVRDGEPWSILHGGWST